MYHILVTILDHIGPPTLHSLHPTIFSGKKGLILTITGENLVPKSIGSLFADGESTFYDFLSQTEIRLQTLKDYISTVSFYFVVYGAPSNTLQLSVQGS